MDAILQMIARKDKNAKSAIEKSNCHSYSHGSGVTLLHSSAGCGNEEVTRYLLEKGCDVDAQDSWGRTPLMMAAMKDREAVVNVLLSAGADVNIPNNVGSSALHIVLARRKVSKGILASFLIAVKKQFSTSAETAENLIDVGCRLCQAAYLKDAAVIEYMLLRHSPVDSRHFTQDYTALHVAVSLGDPKTVKLLLEHGADVNALDVTHETPLFYLYLYNAENTPEKLEILKLLMNHGASLTSFTPRCNFHAYRILMKGDRDAIRIILQSMLDFAARDYLNSKTVLYYFALNTNPGVIEELELHVNKYNVNLIDEMILEPLYTALNECNVEMVKFLLEAGANANLVDHNLPLIFIAYSNRKPGFKKQCDRIFELFLQHKAGLDTLVDPGSLPTIISMTGWRKYYFNRTKAAIAHAAMLEGLGTSIAENALSAICSHAPRNYIERCRRVLTRKISDSVTVLELLTDSKRKMARYMDNELVQKLDRLRMKNKVKLAFPYYFNTVEKRYREAREYMLATTAVCTIFEDRIDKDHLIIRAIMSYLDDRSLRALSKL